MQNEQSCPINLDRSPKKPTIIEIFLLFLKIGSLGFGGGPAVISMIQQETVEKKKWITNDIFTQGFAVSILPPGPMMANTTFFIGGYLRGFTGGLAALIGVLLPSFLLILLIASLVVTYGSINPKSGIMRGIVPAVVGVIFAVAYKMSIDYIKRWHMIFITILSASLMYLYRLPPYLIIISAIILGIVSFRIKNKKR